MSSLENWATDKLGIFLGFDSETIKTQVLPYLMSTESPDIFADRVMEMVGATDDALEFITEFTKRRFEAPKPATPPPPPPPTPPVVERKVTQTPPPPPRSSSPAVSNSEGVFPSLPSNNQPYESMWPANISVHQKKDDEYFSGLRKSKRGQKNKANQDLKSAAILTDKPTVKKEKKKKNEMTLEDALKELDIKAEKPGKKRKPCQCQATKHPLLTAAPNCLNCGKIICTAEGVGPCTFCGSPVLSKEQQVSLIAEAKQKRLDQKQAQQQQQQMKRIPTTTKQGSVPYASKVSGNYIPTSLWDQEEENRLKAEQHKEKLLEFQRTSAQRSTVIDQATDFELPTDQANPWLSPQERALLIKKQQSNLRRIERAGQSSRRKVMTIDIHSKQVKMEDANESSSSSDEEEVEPVKKMILAPNKPAEETSAGTYAHNPLLKGLNGPKFVGKKSKESKGRLRRKERVQYDPNDIMNDYMYTASMGDEDHLDPVNEPVTCQ